MIHILCVIHKLKILAGSHQPANKWLIHEKSVLKEPDFNVFANNTAGNGRG